MAAKNCIKCSSTIADRNFVCCSFCKKYYDLDCANIDLKRFNSMSTEKKREYKCTSCNNLPKPNNSSFPLSQDMMQDKNVDDHHMLTRKKTGTLNHSIIGIKAVVPSSDPVIDSTILNAIRSEIHSAVLCSIELALAPIKSELTAINELKNIMELVKADYGQIKNDIQSCESKMDSLEKENANLVTSVHLLATRLQILEQHSRENNLEINGVPEKKSENLINIVKQVGTLISFPIDNADILSCSRVRKMNESNNRPRSIIVKLPNMRFRDDILAAVTRFNKTHPSDKLSSQHLGHEGNRAPVFVSEHLSPFNKGLHAQARKVARENGFKYVWTRNGRIFIRKDDQSPAKQVKSFETLTNMSSLSI